MKLVIVISVMCCAVWKCESQTKKYFPIYHNSDAIYFEDNNSTGLWTMPESDNKVFNVEQTNTKTKTPPITTRLNYPIYTGEEKVDSDSEPQYTLEFALFQSPGNNKQKITTPVVSNSGLIPSEEGNQSTIRDDKVHSVNNLSTRNKESIEDSLNKVIPLSFKITSDREIVYVNNEVNNLNDATNKVNDKAISKANESERNATRFDSRISANLLTHAVGNFGLKMMQILKNTPSNMVVSPISIALLLSLLQQGAYNESDTQKEISKTLGLTPNQLASSFRIVVEDIQKRDSSSPNLLKIATNIFTSQFLPLNSHFKQVAESNFGSDITPTNFGSPHLAVSDINEWVAHKTNNKIQRILDANDISENSVLVLVNAIYFKGKWSTKFRTTNTAPGVFQLNDGSTRKVPFMHAKRNWRLGRDEENGALAAVLPFENDQFTLTLILPSESSNVNDLISTLTTDKLVNYQSFSQKEADYTIPKFTIRADINLQPVLKMMGIKSLFSKNSGLSGIGGSTHFIPQISRAVHAAMLSIDEEGGTAAGATAFGAVALSLDYNTLKFRADRPFVAVLWDKKLSLPLFIAKIEDPTT